MENDPEGCYGHSVVMNETARNLPSGESVLRDSSRSVLMLDERRDDQEHPAQVYRKFGRCYQQMEAGTHYSFSDLTSTSSVLEAAFELQAAAQQSIQLHKNLKRASKAAGTVRWCGATEQP
jgi:hypothetical protein